VGREQALHCRSVTVGFRSTCEARNRENRRQKYMRIDQKFFFLASRGHGMMAPAKYATVPGQRLRRGVKPKRGSQI